MIKSLDGDQVFKLNPQPVENKSNSKKQSNEVSNNVSPPDSARAIDKKDTE
jgi:hypothetical protein